MQETKTKTSTTLRRILSCLGFAFSLVLPSVMQAGIMNFRLGPPGVGTGGTNPVGLPPGASDLEFGYVTASKWETSASVVPGIFLGKRIDFKGPYVSLGGGIAISANGVGPGPYSAFGYDFGSGPVRFNVEYKQAIGFTSGGIVNPYALRIGLAWY